jgi:hypothetical protein
MLTFSRYFCQLQLVAGFSNGPGTLQFDNLIDFKMRLPLISLATSVLLAAICLSSVDADQVGGLRKVSSIEDDLYVRADKEAGNPSRDYDDDDDDIDDELDDDDYSSFDVGVDDEYDDDESFDDRYDDDYDDDEEANDGLWEEVEEDMEFFEGEVREEAVETVGNADDYA